MLYKIRLLLLISVLSNTVIARQSIEESANKEVEENVIKNPVKKGLTFDEKLSAKIINIINLIKNEYPSYGRQLKKSGNEDYLVKEFVDSLGCGIEYIRSTDKYIKEKVNDNKENGKKADVYRGITIADNKILYLRLDSFSEAAYKKLHEDCVMTSRLKNAPLGIILDLRKCNSYDFEYLRRSLEIFCSPESLGLTKSDKSIKRIYSIPVGVLIGSQTSGVAEVFAHLLAEAKLGLLIGEFSAGKPFTKKQIRLENSDSILVPEVPEFIISFPVKPIKPAISMSAYPQIEFKKISETIGEEYTDKCLYRAEEILIGLNAVENQWK